MSNIFPTSLTYLKFDSGFNNTIEYYALPSNFEHLDLGCNFNNPITFLLPSNLKFLQLGSYHNPSLNNNFPHLPNLTHLSLTSHQFVDYTQVIFTLPQS